MDFPFQSLQVPVVVATAAAAAPIVAVQAQQQQQQGQQQKQQMVIQIPQQMLHIQPVCYRDLPGHTVPYY